MSIDAAPKIGTPRLSNAEAFGTLDGSNVSMILTDPSLPDHPIVYANAAFERTTGYTAEMAIGRNCRFLQGDETDPDDVKRLREAIAAREDVTVDLLNYRADGTPFMNRLLLTPIHNNVGALQFFLGIQKPLSESEDRLSPNAARHAMREVQHRVKNHLAMVISLVRMHGRGAGEARKQFETLSRRIESLQVLYQELSNPERRRNMDSVSGGAYLSRLAAATHALDGRPGVRLNLSLDEVEMPVEKAVSLGLILSEVLTNALQHAFDGRETGLLELRLQQLNDGAIRVIVSDDGVGFAPDAKWPDTSSVGGNVVQGLIHQLDGSVLLNRGNNGTVVTLDFPDIAIRT